MNGVFVDSNVIIHHLAGDNKAKEIIENVESGGDTGYINQIVVSEVIFICLKLKTKKSAFELKKAPDIVKRVDLKNVYELLDTFIELQSDKEITRSAEDVIARYGLLPNDALIAATCKHHGIRKLATFNGDFKQVAFVEIIK
jgi:predicted nucleic acid-binding protein